MRYVFLLLGLLFVGAGSFVFWDDYRQGRECTERVVATVSNVEREIESTPRRKGKKSREHYSYTPVLKYKVNGVVYDEKARISDTSPTTFPVGASVPIMCDPDNPSYFYLEEHRAANTALIFIAIGVGLIGVGLILVTRPRREQFPQQ